MNITGSPYHMRIGDFLDVTSEPHDDLGGGQMDRSLSSDAIVFPGSITIVKEAEPESDQVFQFTVTEPDTSVQNLDVVDDGVVDPSNSVEDLIDFGVYTVTEIVPDDWELQTIDCVVDIANGGELVTDVDTATATITLAESENVTCTFANLLQNPSIALDKSLASNADEDGSGDVSAGDTLTYDFVATNDGNVTLTGVTITDPLPGLSALTCTPTQPATLDPTDTLSCTATYVVTAADVTAGSIDNTATASSDQAPDDTDDKTVPVPTPSLSVDKPAPVNADDDGSGDVSAGDTLTYTITATNTSAVANLTDVVVTDNLITPTGGTTPCALVAPGGTCTLVGTYVVTADDVTAGSIDNIGTGDSDQAGPVDDPETVEVPSPLLTLTKSHVNDDLDGSGDASPGDILTYTYTVSNGGTATLTKRDVG